MSENSITLNRNEHTASASSFVNKNAVLKHWCYLISHLLMNFWHLLDGFQAIHDFCVASMKVSNTIKLCFANIFLGLGDNNR